MAPAIAARTRKALQSAGSTLSARASMASMPRPLIIIDCDEVILHMVVPFRDWLDAEHGIDFDLAVPGFMDALRRRPGGEIVPREEIWGLLDRFFADEMHRQYPAHGAIDALGRLRRHADIVVLTNVGPRHQDSRTAQLQQHGLALPVVGSFGEKGPPAADIAARHAPTQLIFIDDLPQHHRSVAEHLPHSWRLHMVCEPALAPAIPVASAAHARIDDWAGAEQWVMARLAADAAAPPLETPLL